jgi:hypothetical protein
MPENTGPIEYRGCTIIYEPDEGTFADRHFQITGPTGSSVGRERTVEAAKARIDEIVRQVDEHAEDEASRREVN